METVIPENIKNYFFEKLIKSEYNKFIKLNSNIKEKTFCPILINSQNSYLAKIFIEKIFTTIFPEDKNIKSNNEHRLNSKLSFNIKLSKNQIEINPNEYGINDRYIIGEYVNDVSSMHNIATGNKKNIIIWNIDKIGDIAFQSLHNIIKMNEDSANFICISQSLNKIKKSIFSSVILFHIDNPSEQFYIDFFKDFNISNSVNINQIKVGCTDYSFNSFLKNIAVYYNFSLSSFEPFENSFRKFIENIYEKITSKNRISDTFLEEIRNLLYDLYVYHFTYNEIINIFIDIISKDKLISEHKKEIILNYSCYFNNTSCYGNKEIIHLEAFIYNFMNIYHEESIKQSRKIRS